MSSSLCKFLYNTLEFWVFQSKTNHARLLLEYAESTDLHPRHTCFASFTLISLQDYKPVYSWYFFSCPFLRIFIIWLVIVMRYVRQGQPSPTISNKYYYLSNFIIYSCCARHLYAPFSNNETKNMVERETSKSTCARVTR